LAGAEWTGAECSVTIGSGTIGSGTTASGTTGSGAGGAGDGDDEMGASGVDCTIGGAYCGADGGLYAAGEDGGGADWGAIGAAGVPSGLRMTSCVQL
jgi:hypothetical protein